MKHKFLIQILALLTFTRAALTRHIKLSVKTVHIKDGEENSPPQQLQLEFNSPSEGELPLNLPLEPFLKFPGVKESKKRPPLAFLQGLNRGSKINNFVPGLLEDLERIGMPGFLQEPQDLENEFDLVKIEPTGHQPHPPNPESEVEEALDGIKIPGIPDFIPEPIEELEGLKMPTFVPEREVSDNGIDLVKFAPIVPHPHRKPEIESEFEEALDRIKIPGIPDIFPGLIEKLEGIKMPKFLQKPDNGDNGVVPVEHEPNGSLPHRKSEEESEFEEALERIKIPGIPDIFPGLIEDLSGIKMPKFLREPDGTENGRVSVEHERIGSLPHRKPEIGYEIEEDLNRIKMPRIPDFFPGLIEDLQGINMPKLVTEPEDSGNGLVGVKHKPIDHWPKHPNMQSRLREIEVPRIIDFIPELFEELEGMKKPKFVQESEVSDNGIVPIKFEPIVHHPHKEPEIVSKFEEALDGIKMPGIPDFIPGLIEDLEEIKMPKFGPKPEDRGNGLVMVELEPIAPQPHKKTKIVSELEGALDRIKVPGITDFIPELIENLEGIKIPKFMHHLEDSNNGMVSKEFEPINARPHKRPEIESELDEALDRIMMSMLP